MNISVQGYDGPISKIGKVKEEFCRLGHNITDKDVQLIVGYTGFFDRELEIAAENPNAIKIFNLLDVNKHDIQNWPKEKARQQLLQADIPTTISYVSQREIYLQTKVKCDVIYFPALEFDDSKWLPSIEFAFVGRHHNKRLHLAFEALQYLGLNPKSLVVIGPEPISSCVYGGVLPEEELKQFYKSTKFLLFPSKHEGIGLGPIEQVLSSSGFPILTNDNPANHEFDLTSFTADPDGKSIAKKINEINENQDYFRGILDELRPKYKEMFSVKNFCQRILNLYDKKVLEKQSVC